jgi:hypothetical protein
MRALAANLISACIVIGLSWAMTSRVCGAEAAADQNAVLESFFREYLEEAFH